MKIDKTKLLKAKDIAKVQADEAKAAKDAPSLQGMAQKIAALEARLATLESK
jgi:hypothetical protein